MRRILASFAALVIAAPAFAGVIPAPPNTPLQPITQRLPTIYDDTLAGNTTSTVWQSMGRVYTPQSVASGSAVWFQSSQPTTYSKIAAGTGYVTSDTVTLSDGAVLVVTASGGAITAVSSVTTYGTAFTLPAAILTQTATSGVGTGATFGVQYQPVNWNKLPCDVGTPLYCGGLSQMKSGFTGNAVRVNATVATISTDTDIAILADGTFDKTSYYKACAAADAGTYPVISRVYNQMDAAATYAVQNGSVAMPLACVRSSQGNELMAFGNSLARSLALPTAITGVARNALSVYIYGVADSSTFASGSTIWEIGNSDGSGGHTGVSLIGAQSLSVGGLGLGVLTGFVRGGGFGKAYNTPMASNFGLLRYISRGASGTKLCYMETCATDATNQQNQVLTDGGFIGGGGLGAGTKGFYTMGGMVVVGSGDTPASEASRSRAFYTALNMAPQVKDQVVWVGPSLNQGNATLAGLTMGAQLATKLSAVRPINVVNAGTSGITMSLINSDVADKLTTFYNSGARNIAIILGGDNDLTAGTSAAQTFAYLQSVCAKFNAAGFTTVVSNEPWTSTSNPSPPPNIDAYRALINGGTSGCSYLYDPVSNASIAAAGYTMFPDGTHPSNLAGEIWTQGLANLISPLIRN